MIGPPLWLAHHAADMRYTPPSVPHAPENRAIKQILLPAKVFACRVAAVQTAITIGGIEGAEVGASVGDWDGTELDGAAVGAWVGAVVVGSLVGAKVDGLPVGLNVTPSAVGAGVVGATVGDGVTGDAVGPGVGVAVGDAVVGESDVGREVVGADVGMAAVGH